jgi:hypothetical protein
VSKAVNLNTQKKAPPQQQQNVKQEQPKKTIYTMVLQNTGKKNNEE